jgi:hypothetical protein
MTVETIATRAVNLLIEYIYVIIIYVLANNYGLFKIQANYKSNKSGYYQKILGPMFLLQIQEIANHYKEYKNIIP